MALFDFLFGSDEQPHRSGNWTDADDWQCGEQDNHDGMYGFDSYEENDFWYTCFSAFASVLDEMNLAPVGSRESAVQTTKKLSPRAIEQINIINN